MSKKFKNSAVSSYDNIGIFNVFLAGVIVLLMAYFVVISNVTTASYYKVELMEKKLADLIKTNAALTADKLSVEDSPLVLNFAQSHNMIEAEYVTHIFESGDVAALR